MNRGSGGPLAGEDVRGGVAARPELPAPPAARSRPGRALAAVVKYGVGVFLTQSLLGAVLVFGWLQRWTRRAVLRAWWRRSPRRGDGSFDAFAAREPLFEEARDAPNWVLGARRAAGGRGEASWRANARLGVQGLFNVLCLTLPGTVLWLLGWWGGWQNSFHKGYEDYLVGPLVSWVGILLFVGAMFYVPLASARQAVTRRWRAFWQARVVWLLVRRSWAGCAGVAVAAAVLNLGAMGFKTWPYFLPQARFEERVKTLVRSGLDREAALSRAAVPEPGGVDWREPTDDQARAILRRHYFLSGFYVFGALLILRSLTARVYAGAVARAVRDGALGEEDLGGDEWRVLHGLGLLERRPSPRRWLPIRLAAWAAGRVARLAAAATVFLGWFGFVGAVYVSEFLNHHPVVGWLNQPLVQIPWFRYVPARLESPAPEILLALVVLGGGAALGRLLRRGRRPDKDRAFPAVLPP